MVRRPAMRRHTCFPGPHLYCTHVQDRILYFQQPGSRTAVSRWFQFSASLSTALASHVAAAGGPPHPTARPNLLALLLSSHFLSHPIPTPAAPSSLDLKPESQTPPPHPAAQCRSSPASQPAQASARARDPASVSPALPLLPAPRLQPITAFSQHQRHHRQPACVLPSIHPAYKSARRLSRHMAFRGAFTFLFGVFLTQPVRPYEIAFSCVKSLRTCQPGVTFSGGWFVYYYFGARERERYTGTKPLGAN
jgi:hypothetical protein